MAVWTPLVRRPDAGPESAVLAWRSGLAAGIGRALVFALSRCRILRACPVHDRGRVPTMRVALDADEVPLRGLRHHRNLVALVQAPMQVGHVAELIDGVLLRHGRFDLRFVSSGVSQAAEYAAKRVRQTVVA